MIGPPVDQLTLAVTHWVDGSAMPPFVMQLEVATPLESVIPVMDLEEVERHVFWRKNEVLYVSLFMAVLWVPVAIVQAPPDWTA